MKQFVLVVGVVAVLVLALGVLPAAAKDKPTIIESYQANAIVQTAGSAAFGKSRNALNASSLDTTDTLPLRVVGLVESPTNASGDAFTDVLVVFNNTQQILTKLGV